MNLIWNLGEDWCIKVVSNLLQCLTHSLMIQISWWRMWMYIIWIMKFKNPNLQKKHSTRIIHQQRILKIKQRLILIWMMNRERCLLQRLKKFKLFQMMTMEISLLLKPLKRSKLSEWNNFVSRDANSRVQTMCLSTSLPAAVFSQRTRSTVLTIRSRALKRRWSKRDSSRSTKMQQSRKVLELIRSNFKGERASHHDRWLAWFMTWMKMVSNFLKMINK